MIEIEFVLSSGARNWYLTMQMSNFNLWESDMISQANRKIAQISPPIRDLFFYISNDAYNEIIFGQACPLFDERGLAVNFLYCTFCCL